MKIIGHVIFLICLFCFTVLKSQDLHFSQFNENPSLVNPALTGATSVFRASAIYRDQWRSVTAPYKTYGVSVESRFKTTNWNKVEGKSMTFTKSSFSKFAGGLSFYSDKAGDGNMSINQLNASLASFITLNANNRLSLGLQGSLAQRKIDFSKLIFSNQYNGTGYDAAMNNGENVASQVFVYPDLAAGLNWSFTTNDNLVAVNRQKKANVGIAFYHINKPGQSYLGKNGAKLDMKYVLHGDFLFGIPGTNIGIAPTYLFQFQGPVKELTAGTLIKYYINEDSKYTGIIQRTAINVGVFYRYKDAVIFSFSYDKRQQYSIGFSYDFNVSGLSKATRLNGGPEITLKFNTANSYLYQKKPKS
jgi:type IX secretion system PorP/SprF family membrane protein